LDWGLGILKKRQGSRGEGSDGDSTPPEREPLEEEAREPGAVLAGVISPRSLPLARTASLLFRSTAGVRGHFPRLTAPRLFVEFWDNRLISPLAPSPLEPRLNSHYLYQYKLIITDINVYK